jgi:hypothetical protein
MRGSEHLLPGLTDAGARDYNTLSQFDRNEDPLYAFVERK